MKYRLILILVLLIVACSKPNNPPNDGLVVSFRITDDAGDKVAEFRLGEEIFFEFSVINRTGEDQAWSSAYYLPVAPFALYRDSVLFGATCETKLWDILPYEGVLKNGDTLRTLASWFDHSWHAPPPVGEYTVFAILNYVFDDLKPPKEWPIDLTVVPPAAGSEEVFA